MVWYGLLELWKTFSNDRENSCVSTRQKRKFSDFLCRLGSSMNGLRLTPVFSPARCPSCSSDVFIRCEKPANLNNCKNSVISINFHQCSACTVHVFHTRICYTKVSWLCIFGSDVSFSVGGIQSQLCKCSKIGISECTIFSNPGILEELAITGSLRNRTG